MKGNNSVEQLNSHGNRRGMSPNSRKNLDNGRKGNNHAKKDYSITSILKDMANKPAEERWLEVADKGKELTWRQAAAKRIWIEAVRGNAKILSELQDRLEGKVSQPIGGEGGQPIKHIIEVVDQETKQALTDFLNK